MVALTAHAEELDDQIAIGPIGFQRRHMPHIRALAHGPDLADVVEPQMQMEGGVHDIDPRPHLLDVHHRAGVNLHASPVGNETHQRDRIAGHQPQHDADAVAIHLPGLVFARQRQCIDALDVEFAQDVEELMRIVHGRPAAAQVAGLAAIERAARLRLRALRDCAKARRLVREHKALHQRLIGLHIGSGAQMHLEHGLAMGVKHLQAAAWPLI